MDAITNNIELLVKLAQLPAYIFIFLIAWRYLSSEESDRQFNTQQLSVLGNIHKQNESLVSRNQALTDSYAAEREEFLNALKAITHSSSQDRDAFEDAIKAERESSNAFKVALGEVALNLSALTNSVNQQTSVINEIPSLAGQSLAAHIAPVAGVVARIQEIQNTIDATGDLLRTLSENQSNLEKVEGKIDSALAMLAELQASTKLPPPPITLPTPTAVPVPTPPIVPVSDVNVPLVLTAPTSAIKKQEPSTNANRNP